MTTKNAASKNKRKSLKRVEFGNPILRAKARSLSLAEISSRQTQALIKNMHLTLSSLQLGIGLAAPQVGEGVALAVIVIRPTPHRPDVEQFELVLINPEITNTYGIKKQMWEGCISSGKGRTGLFAKVPRFNKIKVKFLDEQGRQHHKEYKGLEAHVIQHETDHLNGILFVDKVKDTTSYMTYSEYMKQMKKT